MVQFTIVLLLTAPLFLVISLFARGTWRTWAGAALVTMGLGTLAAWIAVGSGHAAGQLVEKTPTLVQAITVHEALGVRTLTLFTTLTVVLIALMLVPVLVKKTMPGALRIALYGGFLLFYLGATMVVANTADRGGRLVHELGVQAMVANEVAANTELAAPPDSGQRIAEPQPPAKAEGRGER